MATMTDESLERRRSQNRIAQRRFRQKKYGNRKSAERRVQEHDGGPSLYNATRNINSYWGEFILSPGDDTPPPVDILTISHQPRVPSGSYACSNSFADAYSDFSEQSPVVPDDIGGPEPALANGTSMGHIQNLCRSTGENILEPLSSTIPSLTNEWPGSLKVNSSWQPGGDGKDSTLTAETDIRHTGQSSSSGWLSPLHMAARRGHGGVMRVLLQQNPDCNERDSDGLTPLMHAAAGGHDEAVSLLLQYGARLSDVDSHRQSALHLAVLARRETLLRLLLKHAINDPFFIDGYDDAGRTPLHLAIDLDFEPGVAALLKSGANLHARAKKS